VDGSRVAALKSAANQSELTIWDLRRGVALETRSFADRAILLSPHGLHELLLLHGPSLNRQLTQQPWDREDALTRVLPPDLAGEVSSNSDGSLIVARSADQMRVWDMSKARPSPRLLPEGTMDHVFDPSRNRLALTGRDGVVRIWDPNTAEWVLELRGSTTPVRGLAFDRSGRWLAVSDGQSVRIWDLALQYVRTSLSAIDVDSMAFSSDASKLALTTRSGQVQIWDSDTTPLTVRFQDWLAALPPTESLALHARYIQPGANVRPGDLEVMDRRVRIQTWGARQPTVVDKRTGAPLFPLGWDQRSITGMRVSGNETLFATCEYVTRLDETQVSVRDFPSGHLLAVLSAKLPLPRALAFTSDSHLLACGGSRAIQFWSIQTQQALHRLSVPFDVTRLEFSSDSRVLAAAGPKVDGAQYLLDPITGDVLLQYSGMPPEFLFESPTNFAEQTYGTIDRRLLNASTSLPTRP